MRRYRIGLFVILLSIISGCAANRNKTQTGDGETHFLRSCESNCEAGLSCICSVCTKVCDSDDPCQKLSGDSQCVPVETIRSAGQCEDSDLSQESICSVKCKSDADCEPLDKDFICVSGLCSEKGDTNNGSDDNKTDTDSGSTDSRSTRQGVLDECRTGTDIQSSCLTSGVVIDQDVTKVDTIDLLFVIDNSESMEVEQAKLRDQIPRAIKVLTTGDKTPENGSEDYDFTPVKDLHLAVVSPDMGLPGLSPEENPDATGACNGTGDDGNFLNDPSKAIAAGMICPGIGGGTDGYPIFLEHIRADREDPSVTMQRADATATAFGCITTLGTDGCGYEMPLESALKALWPSQMANLTEVHQNLGIKFLAGSQGHGDNEHRYFLRGTPYHPTEADKLSLLAIVVVTDKDDCSAGARGDLRFLSRNFSGSNGEDVSLRCYNDTVNNWGNKYPVMRYIDGFKALRPQFTDLVVFAAIAGVPNIWEDANDDLDISPQERQDYYNQILTHPDMVETPNPETNNLNYACVHQDPNTGEYDIQALPARRLTEVARGFGSNGTIRSICSDDFTPWMNNIIDVISNKIGGVCLPYAYPRDSNGMIDCDVIWTMPPNWTCDEYSYLSDPPQDKPQFAEDGRKRCLVHQIPVIDPNTSNPSEALDLSQNNGLGWYYDDFSADMERTCKTTDQITTKQRISFTLNPGMNGQNEDPPSGVSTDLECLSQIAIWPDIYYAQSGSSGSGDGQTPREGYSEQMELVGTPCEDEVSREICPPPPVDPGALFCSEGSNVCLLRCRNTDDCPPDWICDDRQNEDGSFLNRSSYPICINPICDLPEGAANNCGNTDVGEPCMPLQYWPGGFSANDIYIETNSPACETGVCGVFQFQGDPRELLTSDCAQYVQERIYCTCHCRSSDPDIPTCTCPDGFECSEDILDAAGPTLAGGYCLRSDTDFSIISRCSTD